MTVLGVSVTLRITDFDIKKYGGYWNLQLRNQTTGKDFFKIGVPLGTFLDNNPQSFIFDLPDGVYSARHYNSQDVEGKILYIRRSAVINSVNVRDQLLIRNVVFVNELKPAPAPIPGVEPVIEPSPPPNSPRTGRTINFN